MRGPTGNEIRGLLETIAYRVGALLEKRGVLARDAENAWLTLEESDDPLLQWAGSSVHYRIAEGPNRGRKVFTLQTLPAREAKSECEQLAKLSGFSLHAGVVVEGHERQKREHLCRYITRPALSEQRLSLAPNGQVRYLLKTPYRDGTTRVLFDPLDFLTRLAALIPKPGIHLTRYHGIFAPNSADRGVITPGGRGRGGLRGPSRGAQVEGDADPSPDARRRGMTWAQRLKRVFRIDVERCDRCGGNARIIAAVEDPAVIRAILAHLDRKQAAQEHAPLGRTGGGELASGRAPPEEWLQVSLIG